MACIGGDDRLQYTIEVQPKDEEPVVYRTIELVSSTGTNGIQRRGTRVWKVVRDDMPNEPPAILKDSWIDTERKREGDILAELRASAVEEEHKTVLDTQFLTVLMHGDVHIDSRPDTTLSEATRRLLTNDGARYLLDAPNPAAAERRRKLEESMPQTGTHHSAQEFRDKIQGEIVSCRTKSRYRIVFKEVCTSLYREPSLPKIFETLGRACVGKCSLNLDNQLRRGKLTAVP